MKFIKFIFNLFKYPFTVYRVMKSKGIYEKNKKRAWSLFYSKNKKYLTTWYQSKGLNSKPPVYYDQSQQKWVIVNRKGRRSMKKK